MLNATDKIKAALKDLAHEQSRPFCYSDYMAVEVDASGNAVCAKCGSDDLMRELPGVGVEYGYEWIMEHIVSCDGEHVDIEEMYRDLLDEVFEPIKFGELTYSASHVLESVDSVAFNMGASEYADSLVEDGSLIELNGAYFTLAGVTS